jgi:hypothetical protein
VSALVWYVGQRDPSVSETITIDGEPFDLTSSTVKFMMRPVGSSTLKVDTAAVIEQSGVDPNIVDQGAVRYDWAAIDVDTAGFYVAWWRVTTGGKYQDQGEFLLEIREHDAASSRAICSRGDVLQLVPGYADDQSTDGIIESLIAAESQVAHNHYGREFVGIESAEATRTFDITARAASQRRLSVGDMTSITSVVIKDINGVELETVDEADRVNLGWKGNRTREAWEPITDIWFPQTTNAASLSEGNVLEVTGVWGFPSIPEDVKKAVAKLVLVRYLADVASAGTALADALNQQSFDAGIAFASAREALRFHQNTVELD